MPSALSDSDWSLRTQPISFPRLMALRRISLTSHSTTTFLSTASGYPPTAAKRTYGGHVYAQAAWACSQTVSTGMFIHNISGWFLVLGDSTLPFRYVISKVRDGGIYCLRRVEVFQDGGDGNEMLGKTQVPCFVGFVGFKRDEEEKKLPGAKGRRKEFGHQDAPATHVDDTYRVALKGKSFKDHPVCPAADGIWTDLISLKQWKQRSDAFPGLEMRKVDMRPYHKSVGLGGNDGGGGEMHPDRFRWLLFYRFMREKDVPVEQRVSKEDEKELPDENDLNLHACAHLYASDRNSLFLGQRSHGFEETMNQMGSLAHTVIFQGPVESLRMVDKDERSKVFLQEAWVSNAGADRICHESRLWNYENGVIVARTLQDGMMRIAWDAPTRKWDGDNLKASKL